MRVVSACALLMNASSSLPPLRHQRAALVRWDLMFLDGRFSIGRIADDAHQLRGELARRL